MGDSGTLSAARSLANLDLWAPVSTDGLPPGLVAAIEESDWPTAKLLLQLVLDSLNTDGIHGRSLLQLARMLPLGIDSVFDRYRASVAIDYGDWDDLRKSMSAAPIGASELDMARATYLASVSDQPRMAARSQVDALFLADELIISLRMGWLRQWARRLPSMDAAFRFSRPDVPASRHFRMRQLHHAALLAGAEAHAGSLDTAAALGHEAMRLGDEGEPLRDIAHDIRVVALLAMGEGEAPISLRLFERTGTPQGLSPLGTLQWIHHVAPFLVLLEDGVLAASASLMQRVATRFGSPKAQLVAEAWVVAGQILKSGAAPRRTDLPALVSGARRADVGLRVLPELLSAYATQRYSGFRQTEHLARRAGMVWAQVAALVWMSALDPSPTTSRNLLRLLAVSGWRRPVFVPDAVLADAVVGMVSTGARGQPLVELALGTTRTTTATEIAMTHATDAGLPLLTRIAAVRSLSRIGTNHSRRLVQQTARLTDEVGEFARTLATRVPRPAGLTDRETEVLDLVGRGMTNRRIADQLSLSHHTVARHLANARDKLGATNRADAAVRLGVLRSVDAGD